jgi:hypothetical protein
MNKPKQQKVAKKPRKKFVKDSTTLSIAKSIAARFGEEIQEDEFYDEPQPEQQASKATV